MTANEWDKVFTEYKGQYARIIKHTDAVLINESLGELYLIESKRYSNPNKKIEEVKEDISRIYDLVAELRQENQDGNPRVPLKDISAIYGVILADAWVM